MLTTRAVLAARKDLQKLPKARLYAVHSVMMDYGFSNFQLLTLGQDDFSLMSGGQVIVPAGASADSLTIQDTPAGDQVNRTYFYSVCRLVLL